MCKVIAGVTWALGILLSITTLFIGEIIISLSCLIYTLITGAIFYAIGKIIDELGGINENLYRISRTLAKDDVSEVIVKENEVPSNTMTPSVNGEWVCKKCQTKNKSSDMICKVCGKYR